MAQFQSSQPQSGLVTSTGPQALGDTVQPGGSGMTPCLETPSEGGSRDGGAKRAAISYALVKLALDYIGQDQPFGARSIEGLIRHCLLSDSRWGTAPLSLLLLRTAFS